SYSVARPRDALTSARASAPGTTCRKSKQSGAAHHLPLPTESRRFIWSAMETHPLRIALISEHASPLATLGGVDAGGRNVHVAHVARVRFGLGNVDLQRAVQDSVRATVP